MNKVHFLLPINSYWTSTIIVMDMYMGKNCEEFNGRMVCDRPASRAGLSRVEFLGKVQV